MQYLISCVAAVLERATKEGMHTGLWSLASWFSQV